MESLSKEYDTYNKNKENNKENQNVNNLFNTLIKKIYDPINKSKQVLEPKLVSNPSGAASKATINYVMKDTSKKRVIKLFDPAFVENNKDKLDMVIKADCTEKNQSTKVTKDLNPSKKLLDYYRNSNCYEIQKMEIELTEKDNKKVADLSYMFNNCEYFSSADFSKWDLNNVISMEAMFQLCKNIQLDNVKSIINNGKNGNLVNIRAMFCKCTNLIFDPDVDKWFFKLVNDTRLKDMSMLFSGCKNMGSINFNAWKNTKFNNLEDISYMFNRCTKLKVVDNLKRFNTIKVKNMCGLFNGCKSLTNLSNLNLNTQSVENTSIMFQGCELLDKIDNGFYDAKSLKDVSGMFANCPKLSSIKGIIYYTSEKLENVAAMFKNCKALTAPPDYMFQKWFWANVKGKEMFAGCDRFTSAPKWLINMKFYKENNLDDLFKDCNFTNRENLISDWKSKQISKSEIN